MHKVEKNPSEIINEWIDKYRYYIGGLLLILIVISSGVLLYRENIAKADSGQKIRMLESRIKDLESTLTELKNQPVTLVETPAAESPASTVPAVQSTDAAGRVMGAVTPSKTPSPGSETQVSGKININTASASQLDTLPGIGPAYAKAIIEYREANGGFKSIEEITKVKGIGPKTLEKFKDRITVN